MLAFLGTAIVVSFILDLIFGISVRREMRREIMRLEYGLLDSNMRMANTFPLGELAQVYPLLYGDAAKLIAARRLGLTGYRGNSDLPS